MVYESCARTHVTMCLNLADYDLMEYMMTINQDNATKKKNAEYMSRTGTFCKFNGSYFDESDTTISPMKH